METEIHVQAGRTEVDADRKIQARTRDVYMGRGTDWEISDRYELKSAGWESINGLGERYTCLRGLT
jgi:hypothetical protein